MKTSVIDLSCVPLRRGVLLERPRGHEAWMIEMVGPLVSFMS